MVAELRIDAGRRRDGGSLHRRSPVAGAGELAGPAPDRAEQQSLGFASQARAVEIGDEVFLEGAQPIRLL